jgi:hypothetical protein
MTEETALLDKREELKHELLASQSRTLVDTVLGGTGGLIQKLTRSSRPISMGYNFAMIVLVALLLGLLIGILLNEQERFSQLGPLAILGVGLSFASLIVAGINTDQILATLRDHLIDAVGSVEDLADLHSWMTNTWASRKSLTFSIVGGLFCGAFIAVLVSAAGGTFIGFGLTLWALLCGVCFGIALYYLYLMIRLPLRLSRYQYDLYEGDPSSSTVVSQLGHTLNNCAYLVAASVAILTLFVASSRSFAWLGILVVLVGWIPVTVEFITTQVSLKRIITTAKSNILGEIEMEVADVRRGAQLADKEAMEALNRLMDYHDRISRTPSSTLNLGAGLNLLSQLLLPLLAFVLANLDRLLGLFAN